MIILILIDQLILLLINLALAMFYYVLYPTTSQGYHLVQRLRDSMLQKDMPLTHPGRLRVMSSPAGSWLIPYIIKQTCFFGGFLFRNPSINQPTNGKRTSMVGSVCNHLFVSPLSSPSPVYTCSYHPKDLHNLKNHAIQSHIVDFSCGFASFYMCIPSEACMSIKHDQSHYRYVFLSHITPWYAMVIVDFSWFIKP